MRLKRWLLMLVPTVLIAVACTPGTHDVPGIPGASQGFTIAWPFAGGIASKAFIVDSNDGDLLWRTALIINEINRFTGSSHTYGTSDPGTSVPRIRVKRVADATDYCGLIDSMGCATGGAEMANNGQSYPVGGYIYVQVPANEIWFDYVLAHEIGHALGFRSGVDLADANALPGRAAPNGARGLNNLAWGTVLDLFRYGDLDGVETLDWSIGGSPCLSINAGASCVGDLSTGSFNGDGRQASHWKDDILLDTFTPLGIMDPTATGKGGVRPFMAITAADLIAFDAIGYDVAQAVPEPATLGMVLVGLGLAGVSSRRRQPVQPIAA